MERFQLIVDDLVWGDISLVFGDKLVIYGRYNSEFGGYASI
ncbi:hypothetical protein [Aquibacillus kalidii]|nr:hypothetical protein [Aquibacillus kalidii]